VVKQHNRRTYLSRDLDSYLVVDSGFMIQLEIDSENI